MENVFENVRQGKLVIVVDDEREGEGDLMVAASKATKEAIAFMLNNGKGFVCVALPEQRLKQLGIERMVERNTDAFSTPFTVTVGTKNKKSGVSAEDRTEVIRLLMNPATKPDDIAKPGHVLPLAANQDGLFGRYGHTEASVDLVRLSGLEPGAVICEVLNEKGEVASPGELAALSKTHGIPTVSVREIFDYRKRNEKVVFCAAESSLPTAYGDFKVKVYRAPGDASEHVALIRGDVSGKKVLARLHSQCLTGEVFGSLRCDCREQLDEAMRRIAKSEGVIVYLRQEGRGIGLLNKIKAYKLQDKGLDTVEANMTLGFAPDERDFWMAAQILKDNGVSEVMLLTNNMEKVHELEAYGVKAERIPLHAKPGDYNTGYLMAKKKKLGHLL
ncbi:GTP cyclohydrolase II [Candidatus Micrarchaeota archaeon]|nr:GTP cyclohydrolase II [Candidatus Micrarchaeota archaeon]